MASKSRLLMEKVAPIQEPPLYRQQQQQQQQQQQSQHGLKCPRCESSNTKFCYYNNYSLSQPRHFCKACKRYWTRGGTLRNVPVGGGCRKNKRSKRSASSLEGANTTTSVGNTASTNTSVSGENPSYNINATSQTQISAISSTSNQINPLLFGLPTNLSELNLPFLGRRNPSSRVSSISTDGCDLQPQLNAPALGFSPGLIMNNVSTSDVSNNGFINPSKQIDDVVVTKTSNPLLPSYTSIFGSSSSPTMATLLASGFHHPKLSVKDTTKIPLDHFHTLTNTPVLEGLQMIGKNESAGNIFKEVKMEPSQSRLEWHLPYQNQNQMEPYGFSDPNTLFWNNTSSAVGAWNDPANIGSSVTSLI